GEVGRMVAHPLEKLGRGLDVDASMNLAVVPHLFEDVLKDHLVEVIDGVVGGEYGAGFDDITFDESVDGVAHHGAGAVGHLVDSGVNRAGAQLAKVSGSLGQVHSEVTDPLE